MAEKYTPTTDEVRDSFIHDDLSGMPDDEIAEAFDRWLNAERARIWDECYEAMEFAIDGYYFGSLPDNPYKED